MGAGHVNRVQGGELVVECGAHFRKFRSIVGDVGEFAGSLSRSKEEQSGTFGHQLQTRSSPWMMAVLGTPRPAGMSI